MPPSSRSYKRRPSPTTDFHLQILSLSFYIDSICCAYVRSLPVIFFNLSAIQKIWLLEEMERMLRGDADFTAASTAIRLSRVHRLWVVIKTAIGGSEMSSTDCIKIQIVSSSLRVHKIFHLLLYRVLILRRHYLFLRITLFTLHRTRALTLPIMRTTIITVNLTSSTTLIRDKLVCLMPLQEIMSLVRVLEMEVDCFQEMKPTGGYQSTQEWMQPQQDWSLHSM